MNRPARLRFRLLALAAAVAAGLLAGSAGSAQEADEDDLVERPPAPKLDDFESDKDRDGVPDGWYNLRDASIVKEGGVVGPHYLKFECLKPGRPARLSRAFGVDGRKVEAIEVGVWIRTDQVQAGERSGDDPGLIIDFLGSQLRNLTRGSLGPWTARVMGASPRWTRVVKRLPVPVGARDAIMSVGLFGATGVLDVDGLTLDLVPRGGSVTTNLARNPGFELGDPDPASWVADNGARRGFPGFRSPACLELAKAGARCMTGLALPVDGFAALGVAVSTRAQGLRGSGGATATFFFVDEDGRQVGPGVPALRFAGSYDWQEQTAEVTVPKGAVRAVFQLDKLDGLGALRVDDVTVTALPDPRAGEWTPDHIETDTARWTPVAPSPGIEPGSALDASFLLSGPAGRSGAVVVKRGRLHFAKGGRARFFGVQLLPPTAFLDPEKSDALADRLARSGVNLVRLGDLDTPLGPDRSLFDDTRDDTARLDPNALARLDHLLAALKKRGIYYALELQSARRFRVDDGIPTPGLLPAGGGPAAVFDPKLKKLGTDAAKSLLTHVNPETGLALKNDPALAWVTLAGEVTMFALIDDPSALAGDYLKEYRDLAARSTAGRGHRFWQGLEASHAKEMAEALRKSGLKAPLAGVSHWRREPEFCEAQAAPGLDLIDDRLIWLAPTWVSPRYRSPLWSLDGGYLIGVSKKRRTDRPYVVGQWCNYTQGVWAYPYEAAEQLLGAATAAAEDWDALVRRGVFLFPNPWGAAAAGTGGGEDIFQLPEVVNGSPHVYALWPHAASVMLRGLDEPATGSKAPERPRAEPPRRSGGRAAARRHHVPGWEPERGRLVVDTPYTQGVAGWPGGEEVTLPDVIVEVENTYGVVVASSVGPEPIARANRLLVSAVARVAPTGFLWTDDWRREAADPGRAPLLQEPVRGRLIWRHKGPVKAFALDNSGKRLGPAPVKPDADGTALVLDAASGALHFEMVAE